MSFHTENNVILKRKKTDYFEINLILFLQTNIKKTRTGNAKTILISAMEFEGTTMSKQDFT